MAGIKTEVLNIIGMPPDSVARFSVYGELMCNSTLFNYAQANLGGTHQLFGAMIRPASAKVANEIAEKLGQAQFACKFRPPKEGEEAEEEAAECGC